LVAEVTRIFESLNLEVIFAQKAGSERGSMINKIRMNNLFTSIIYL